VIATHTFGAHHSGYAVPWSSWSVHRDWHHYRFMEAFGTFALIGRLLGTDSELRSLGDWQEVS